MPLIWIAFAIVFIAVPVFSKNYTYRMVTGTNTNITVYWDEPYAELGFIKVYATNSSEVYDAYCLTNYEAVRWTYQNTDSDTAFLYERRNNLLFISGKVKGMEIQRVVAIDSDPVFQTLSYSLSEFVRSERDMIKFWFVTPGDYAPFKLIAYRMDKEIIKVNGVDVEAFCVKQTLDGPMRNLWHAFYWFRTFDLTYVKYEGINGGPGTPLTVVELIGENGEE